MSSDPRGCINSLLCVFLIKNHTTKLCVCVCFFLWRNSPTRSTAGMTPLNGGSACRRDTQHSQETDIHVPGGIRTCNPSKRCKEIWGSENVTGPRTGWRNTISFKPGLFMSEVNWVPELVCTLEKGKTLCNGSILGCFHFHARLSVTHL